MTEGFAECFRRLQQQARRFSLLRVQDVPEGEAAMTAMLVALMKAAHVSGIDFERRLRIARNRFVKEAGL